MTTIMTPFLFLVRETKDKAWSHEYDAVTRPWCASAPSVSLHSTTIQCQLYRDGERVTHGKRRRKHQGQQEKARTFRQLVERRRPARRRLFVKAEKGRKQVTHCRVRACQRPLENIQVHCSVFRHLACKAEPKVDHELRQAEKHHRQTGRQKGVGRQLIVPPLDARSRKLNPKLYKIHTQSRT